MTEKQEYEENSWGTYMDVKKRKLAEQFDQSLIGKSTPCSDMFKDVHVYVNGYTNPSSDILKKLIGQYGGHYHAYQSSTVTHVIASNLCKGKIDRLTANSAKIVRPEWILDCIKGNRLLPEDAYRLYYNPEKSIKLFLEQKHKFENEQPSKARDNRAATKTAKDDGFIKDFYSRSRLHMISTWCQEMKEYVRQLQLKSDGKFSGIQKIIDFMREKPSCSDSIASANTVPSDCVMHLDMDCFFVSVGLLKRPELRGTPVAVTHSKGKGPSDGGSAGGANFYSRAEVASCSYEARAKGVNNGMYLGEALKLCPDLKTVPYDFDEYKRISRIFYEIVAGFTLDLEVVSCDEMYVNLSNIMRITQAMPLHIATVIRRELFSETGCPSSAGIGPNKLLARLATKRAKPNGQFYVKTTDADNLISSLNVADLPGIGYSMATRLKVLNVETCLELRRLPINVLTKEFGAKIGLRLYEFARGVDRRPIFKLGDAYCSRKSVSCDVNYGIRFTTINEVEAFLRNLAVELSDRLRLANVRGKNICLKCLVRTKNAPVQTHKFLGHGEVDGVTRSLTLVNAIDDPDVIHRHSVDLLQQMELNVEDLRGIGLSIHKLAPTLADTQGPSLQNFLKKTKKSDETATADVEEKDLSSLTVDNVPSYAHTVSQKVIDDGTFAGEPSFCGTSSYEEIKDLLSEWVSSSGEPDAEDCALFLQYAVCCIQRHRAHLVYKYFRHLHAILSQSNPLHESWKKFYESSLGTIQKLAIDKYNYPLRLPRF